MRRDNYAICLHREEGTYPVRTHALQAGNQHPLGIGAGSLAMLSALTMTRSSACLRRTGRLWTTQYAFYPEAQIRDDVPKTRERGYALNPGRIVAGSWGLGTACLLPDGRVAGALSVAAIDIRMNAGAAARTRSAHEGRNGAHRRQAPHDVPPTIAILRTKP